MLPPALGKKKYVRTIKQNALLAVQNSVAYSSRRWKLLAMEIDVVACIIPTCNITEIGGSLALGIFVNINCKDNMKEYPVHSME